MKWICDKAIERAAAYNIEGVDYTLTMGVVKNIIPAIASTNAIVSASCVSEAIKVLTNCNLNVDNYMMYMGQTGIYTHTYRTDKVEECTVCQSQREWISVPKSKKFGEWYEELIASKSLQAPGVGRKEGGSIIYIQNPPQL